MNPLPMITKPGVSLIGISGKAGSGKDTIAEYLVKQYENHFIYPFADPLKSAASVLFGLPISDFYSRELKEIKNDTWGVSPRQIAQFLGTESVRLGFEALLPEGIATNFWIKRLCEHINGRLVYLNRDWQLTGAVEAGDTIIIPDVRFQNEYDWVIANGGIVIQVSRDGADGSVGIPGHASEMGYTSIDNERTFKCVNNSTLEDLYLNVDGIMTASQPSADSMEL